MQILEKNQVRLLALREKTEDKLREKLTKLDEKLKELLKRVEAYKNIGVSVVPFFLLFLFSHDRFSCLLQLSSSRWKRKQQHK